MSPFGFHTPCEDVAKAFADRVKQRTFLITGTSAKGLGANTAITLAKHSPTHIILVSRNKTKVQPVIDEITSIDANVKTTFVSCELSDFESVRKAADEILNDAAIPKIDVVINNAGIMNVKEYTKDKQGYELTFSSCHLGHFLFTNLILPKVLAAGPGARIVNVTSRGHRIGPVRLDDYNFSDGKAYDGWSAYGQAKSANMLFSVELTRRLEDKGIRSVSVHPGGIWDTGLTSHLTKDDFVEVSNIAKRNNGRDTFRLDDPKTPSQGTAPLVAAALDPSFDDKGGCFIEDCQIGDPETYAVDPENAKKLWALSEQLVGKKFDI
ncbi:short-chain dehydrogenase [Stachybotrys elegans]|uniref:Short-chain dehydrogenase n=1 Tax=Stachybotrys elegans TaxID=80388 RepID=A0A8K0SEP2_9HYPO|nr:short-chain dehydrogenase [Stachybotrys elegans]